MSKSSRSLQRRQANHKDLLRVIDLKVGRFMRRCSFVTSLTTDAGGNYVANITSDTVRSSPATEWASFAARYTEFRVLEIAIHYVPYFAVNITLTSAAVSGVGPVVLGYDASGAASITTEATCFALVDSRLHNLREPWVYKGYATTNDQKLFGPTGSAITATSLYSLRVVVNSQIATLTYGRIFYEWAVEFTGAI